MFYIKVIFITLTLVCICNSLGLYKTYRRVQKSQEDWELLIKKIKISMILLIIYTLMGALLIILR